MSPEDDVVMEGYLFKRATNAFKTWHRRWFQIKDNRLLYSHRSADVETPTVMEADLKLCLVRQAPSSVERACCFELEVFLHPTGMSPEDDVVMEGYLFKRATNAFKTWHRRWFQIKDNRLLYSHRSADVETPTVMEADLKLCLVRQAPSSVERACCFELVTPTKSHLLQADSETLCTAWIRALQRTIHHLHENDESLPANVRTFTSTNDETVNHNLPIQSKDTLLAELRRIPGNDKCADCGADSPKWASINLGVLLCIECCGIHRSFGVQVSKVRSLTMDSLEPEQRKLMIALGNRLVNSIYLAHLPNANIVPPPPRPTSSRPVRKAWIKAKYVERRFARLDIERARNSANVRAEGLRRNTAAKAISPTRSNSDRKLYEGRYAARSPSEPVAGSRLSPTTPKNEWKSTPSIAADLKRVASCGSDSDIDGSQEVIDNSKCGARVLKAAALGDVAELCRLVAEGVDVHAPYAKTTALHTAIKNAAALGDVAELCRLVAEGVDIHAPYAKTTALHTAIKNNQGMAAEFLMLNGSKVNALDASLNSPLHIACANALTLLVCQLMKRGADQRLRNCNGETALDLAIEGTHADIVTLLRLQEMRDEFTEEFNNPMDETVDDVMMDISRRMDPSLR
uniref:Uncharacterized protein n=1 Tax=Ascaris lumbricoides TaxID=6252 RepID=A0A9J2PL33_ASCLU